VGQYSGVCKVTGRLRDSFFFPSSPSERDCIEKQLQGAILASAQGVPSIDFGKVHVQCAYRAIRISPVHLVSSWQYVQPTQWSPSESVQRQGPLTFDLTGEVEGQTFGAVPSLRIMHSFFEQGRLAKGGERGSVIQDLDPSTFWPRMALWHNE
jgi:hypothetical protein